jgi:hypothetical protein
MSESPAGLPGHPPEAVQAPADEPAMVTAGRSLVASAAARSIPVRLLGGVAIWIRASAAARAALGRAYPDIDLAAHKKQSRQLRAVLESQGLEPERVFNATHGARRLLYHAPPAQPDALAAHPDGLPGPADGPSGGPAARGGGWHVDVFLDTFEMSHTLDLGTRLEAEPETLAAAELLLTKLQIAEVNRKDLSDAAMLLWDHEPAGRDGPGELNTARMAKVCGEDWGLYTTTTGNLAACADLLSELVPAKPDRARIAGRIGAITGALQAAPKTVGWRMRAKVGRRVRWYEVPEEVVR